MEKQSRVEKYKKLREEISQLDTYRFDNPYSIPQEDNLDENDIAMNDETLKTEHIKKSTLSISLDQLIKAHDEYTIMMHQEEIKKQKKEEDKEKFTKVKNLVIVSIIIGLLIAILVILLIILLK